MANYGTLPISKRALNFLYGIGAAVVIIGAWAKIIHLPWANTALTAGLLTEALIFALQAFLDQPEAEPDWTLAYPELANGIAKTREKKSGLSASQQLDNMLEEAKIGPELIKSLGTGFKSLNDNVSKMSDLSDATVATKEYAQNVKLAAGAVGQLSQAATSVTQSVSALNVSNELSQQYKSQVQSLVTNLTTLNNTYIGEQKNADQHLQQMNKFYANIAASMDNLNNAQDDSRRYKEEIAKLSKNLSALNGVYGNMLTAMNITPRV